MEYRMDDYTSSDEVPMEPPGPNPMEQVDEINRIREWTNDKIRKAHDKRSQKVKGEIEDKHRVLAIPNLV